MCNKIRPEITLYILIKKDLGYVNLELEGVQDFSVNILDEQITIENDESVLTIVFNDFVLNTSNLPLSSEISDHSNVDRLTMRIPLREVKLVLEKDNILSIVKNCSNYENNNLNLVCRKCSHQLIQVSFENVLPLPNDSWGDLSDTWFCHRHGHCGESILNKSDTNCQEVHAQTEANSMISSQFESASEKAESTNTLLLPEEGQCLVGSKEFIINVEDTDFTIIEDGYLECKACHATIGQRPHNANSSIHYLYHHALGIEGQFISMPRFGETFFTHLLLTESELGNSYRYIIESRINGKFKAQFLIWIMDKRCCVAGMSTEVSTGSATVQITPINVLKLLYRSCKADQKDSVLSAWRRDLAVDSIDIPLDLADTVLLALVESTETLPDASRRFQEFFVGQLPR